MNIFLYEKGETVVDKRDGKKYKIICRHNWDYGNFYRVVEHGYTGDGRVTFSEEWVTECRQ